MKKVMVFGTFDVLHRGHEDLFRQAKEYGDFLIAVVARDSNVLRFKKIRPHQNELERLENVQKYVDKAILGHEDDIYKVLEEERPAVICLGYDQNSQNLELELKKRYLKIDIVRLLPFEPERQKSTLKRKKLKYSG